MHLMHRYNVEAVNGKPGVPEWPMVIQDMVVDMPHAGDPSDVCRLKYDRLGEAAQIRIQALHTMCTWYPVNALPVDAAPMLQEKRLAETQPDCRLIQLQVSTRTSCGATST